MLNCKHIHGSGLSIDFFQLFFIFFFVKWLYVPLHIAILRKYLQTKCAFEYAQLMLAKVCAHIGALEEHFVTVLKVAFKDSGWSIGYWVEHFKLLGGPVRNSFECLETFQWYCILVKLHDLGCGIWIRYKFKCLGQQVSDFELDTFIFDLIWVRLL